MKKKITTLFLFAATMLVALTFTACGEEVDVPPTHHSTGTIFSVSDDENEGTRTSIKNNANFFWEKGDKIWVYDGTDWKQSGSSNITGTQEKAKFVVDGNFSANSHKVIYTGYTGEVGKDTTNTSPTKVTIADQQTQSAWNNGQHLSVSGDCGTATAYKQPGGYKFKLDHKASYLLLYPYLAANLTGNYTLEKIEIYSNLSASYIAGEYDFTFDDGLGDSPISGTGKQEITLNCRNVAGTGFLLDRNVPDMTNFTSPSNHCFVVIAPGVHQLTVLYHVKNASGTVLEFVEDIALAQYEPNGVYVTATQLQNNLTPAEYEHKPVHYQWGATSTTGDRSTSTTAVTYYPWTATPNSNEMTWYAQGNYLYWDNAVRWVDRSTNQVKRGGLWVRRSDYPIPGFSSTSYLQSLGRRTVKKGRPEVTELHTKWFFLPAFEGPQTIYYFNYPMAAAAGYAWMWEISSSGTSFPISSKAIARITHIEIYKDGVRLNNTAPWKTSPWYAPQ